MTDSLAVSRERRTYLNSTSGAVLYPLGSIKVEVPPGQTLVYFTEEKLDNAFTRARARQKLAARVGPALLVVGILVVALFVVFTLSMKVANPG